MSKLYLGGSLFNEAEVNQRIKEGNLLGHLSNYDIYNPIQAPCNQKEQNLPTSEDIFWGDTNEILASNVVVMDMSNQTDLGCATEVGIVWMCNYLHKLAEEGKSLEEILAEIPKKTFVGHLSDIRKSTSHLYRGSRIPWGINQYYVGCALDMGEVKESFQEVLDDLVPPRKL